MSTGIPEIDEQHKELFEKYNNLDAAMSNRMLSIDETAETLDFLQFYAIWHFEREEEYFEQYDCPIVEANKKAHAQFIEMFGKFYKQWQTENLDPALVQATYAELGKWIKNHIIGIDAQLYTCIND